MHEFSSLTSVTRHIAAVRNRPAVPRSQASLFEVFRNLQMASPAEFATRKERRYRRNAPLNQANLLRSSKPVARAEGSHEEAHAESVGNVVVQMDVHLSEKITAQSAAQMSALFRMMRHFEDMRVAHMPSQCNQSTFAHPSLRPSVQNVHAFIGEPIYRFPQPSAPISISYTEAYATLVVASKLQLHTTELLAFFIFSIVAGSAIYPANKSNPKTASPFAPLVFASVPGAAAKAPNPLILQSFQTKLHYISLLSQYAPMRATSTVTGSTAPKPVTPSALHALAAFAAAQPATDLPAMFFQLAAPANEQLAVAYLAMLSQIV